MRCGDAVGQRGSAGIFQGSSASQLSTVFVSGRRWNSQVRYLYGLIALALQASTNE